MPEIFVEELPLEPSEKELKGLADAVAELAQIAAFAEWFDGQSKIVQELGRELGAIQAARGMNPRFQIDTLERYGRPLYVAHCANGRHESRQSEEHAMFLLVDSFRTRIEDKPETHERIMEIHGMDLKSARRYARELAQRVQEAHGKGVPGETRDKLFARELEDEEEALTAPRRNAMKLPPPKAFPVK